MIRINILFPKDKKRVEQAISKAVEKKYKVGVKKFHFSRMLGILVLYYVELEDDRSVEARVSLGLERSITIDKIEFSEDLSF